MISQNQENILCHITYPQGRPISVSEFVSGSSLSSHPAASILIFMSLILPWKSYSVRPALSYRKGGALCTKCKLNCLRAPTPFPKTWLLKIAGAR